LDNIAEADLEVSVSADLTQVFGELDCELVAIRQRPIVAARRAHSNGRGQRLSDGRIDMETIEKVAHLADDPGTRRIVESKRLDLRTRGYAPRTKRGVGVSGAVRTLALFSLLPPPSDP
jgi:hypothetical protein